MGMRLRHPTELESSSDQRYERHSVVAYYHYNVYKWDFAFSAANQDTNAEVGRLPTQPTPRLPSRSRGRVPAMTS